MDGCQAKIFILTLVLQPNNPYVGDQSLVI
jgi:hypothetical protein